MDGKPDPQLVTPYPLPAGAWPSHKDVKLEPAEPTPLIEPAIGASEDEWFEFYRRCQATGKPFSHKDLGNRLSIAPASARNKYSRWMQKKGLKPIQKT